MQSALFVFYNGDTQIMQVADGLPPGRLEWREDENAPVTREFWLDSELWAREGTAAYREVARMPR